MKLTPCVISVADHAGWAHVVCVAAPGHVPAVVERRRVMLIDARQQFEKEPKSFGNKRKRIADVHRAWIEDRYNNGWATGFSDEHVKIFQSKDFAYHKVNVVFWQTDEHDQPAIITEPYEKAFTAANIKKEQDFLESEVTFRVRVKFGDKEKTVEFIVDPK